MTKSLLQARSQKIFLGSAFEEKVDLLILYMYRSPGAVEEFIIVGCMLIAHIHKGLYLKVYFVYMSYSYTAVYAKIR